MTRLSVAALVLASLVAFVPGQNPSGAPGCYIAHDPPRIGDALVIDIGHASLPFGFAVLSLSDGYGPTNHPQFGPVWLDITSSAYQLLFYNLDIGGNARIVYPIPNDPSLFGSLTLFANAFVLSSQLPAPGWGLSKTVRLEYQTLDGWNPVSNTLATPRFGHTATSLAANPRSDRSRVLIAGGAGGSMMYPQPTPTTELYNPMKREFEAGPNMLVPRVGHTATLLQDGRILVTGGVRNPAGVVTATCELYDPSTNTFTLTAPMTQNRSTHAATLLNDGRVLVSGGVSTWANAGTAFANVLNSSRATAEVYDPQTGAWTFVPTTMQIPRSGHTQTLLANGEVLVVGGIRGGGYGTGGSTSQVPWHTATADRFIPGGNTFIATSSMATARGWHAASLLANGSVLVTGGSATTGFYGDANPVASCEIWNGAVWQSAQPLSVAVAFHTQVRSRYNADAIVVGGYRVFGTLSGDDLSARHNGFITFDTLEIGVHASIAGSSSRPRGFHTCTELYDGSYLVVGGSDANNVLDDGYTIVEW